ncbi:MULTISPECIES: elongator complex protein 3 [unclassified Ruminococcus]|uniref:elongator complex protein 3 n=1 Tax=unclassified Ruminococcus TaxID=2608920 RepID=UPI00210DBAC5|nr:MULTISPECIES: radical SAM protein [unclassified Ruminococcus]MCQ4021633.1 radical SAM protein [Ruminococcus sp. zg-924]MCQ4114078.1 radical SAM protein [Ruminococcus sp. zg-921]
MKRSNVAIFVPHKGCPNQCTFCNQNEITGCTSNVTKEDVISAVETSLYSGGYSKESEIAFFGGSFTGIDPEYMEMLLQAAYQYVSQGLFKGIRISTRPDYINQEILDTLKKYGVTSIELGAQSMDDEVLKANKRGHSAQNVVEACELIKQNGFSLGLQMMTGLYKSDEKKDIYTAQQLSLLQPDTMRIYPTIVLKYTELAILCLTGKYYPQSLEEAVNLCAKLLDFFDNMNIKVIRLGLHDSPSLKKEYIAGPYHPAFRELCESKLFVDKFLNEVKNERYTSYVAEVNPSYLSKALGQKKANIECLRDSGYDVRIIQNQQIQDGKFKLTPIE